jgi:hypothetical protein
VGYGALARRVLGEGEQYDLGDVRFVVQFRQAVEGDPDFAPAPRHLVADVDVDAIKYLGGGSTISMRFNWKRDTFGAFKPAQILGATNYRSEIASWRLASLLRLRVFVPRNRHVFLERDAFNTLYGRISDPAHVRYGETEFVKLSFAKHPQVGEVLHGTLKTWLPEFTRLPIENTHIWEPWLSLDPAVSRPLGDLNAPAIGSITVEDTRGSSKDFEMLRKHIGGATEREIARQISDLLLFDFLIANWDRFSGNPRFRGGNCHFAYGQIVALDNGASFSNATKDDAAQRLRPVHRFRRQTVRALRDLERDVAFGLLFPEPTRDEIARFEQFWHNRTLALEMIDALVLQYGERAVLDL